MHHIRSPYFFYNLQQQFSLSRPDAIVVLAGNFPALFIMNGIIHLLVQLLLSVWIKIFLFYFLLKSVCALLFFFFFFKDQIRTDDLRINLLDSQVLMLDQDL